jgi:hypothetical protein
MLKSHLTCFSSIYLSFAKLLCENMRKLDGTGNSILHATFISSTKRYFKMQSACRPKGHLLTSFPPEGHLLANRLTPHTLYKPQQIQFTGTREKGGRIVSPKT